MIRSLGSILLLFVLAVGASVPARAAEPVWPKPPPKARLAPATSGRAATLKPISSGRAARLAPVTRDRAAKLAPMTRDRAASLKPISSGRAARLAPVTRDRAAKLAPVTRDRAASLKPISSERAAGLAPVTRDRAANLAPVTRDRAASLMPSSSGRAARLLPVTRDRAASLAPVTRGRAASLSTVSSGRAARLAMLFDSRPPVYYFEDGYVAPYRARGLVRDAAAGDRRRRDRDGGAKPDLGTTNGLYRAGVGAPRKAPVEVGDLLDSIDPDGPHRVPPAAEGEEGKNADRRPRAYYVRPVSVTDEDTRLILVPADSAEEIPDSFAQAVRKSRLPLVIGDVAFKNGDYVRAALAFREAKDRKPRSISARFALGDALIALRNYGNAAESIRAGLDASPRWADALDRRGVYGNAKDHGKHLADVEAFTEAVPRSRQALFLLGYLRMTSGSEKERSRASEAFRRVLALDPDDQISRRYLELLEE